MNGSAPPSRNTASSDLTLLELQTGRLTFIQIVDTTASAQVIIYQLDVSILPAYQGATLASVPLATIKFSTDHVLTLRVNNGSSATIKISGLVILSIT